MLSLRWIGAILIIGSSTWVGLHGAQSLKRTDRRLKALCACLTLMENELRYTNTKFEPLCARLAEASQGEVSAFFRDLSQQAGKEDYQQIGAARRSADRTKLVLPPAAFFTLEQLIDGFGRYDLDGQLRQIGLASEELQRQLAHNRENLESRCRTWELLGICTGAAVMILVI